MKLQLQTQIGMCSGRQRHRGFSLVELLVAVAIIGLLAGIAMPLAELSRQRAKEEDLRRALRQIRTALDEYKHLVDIGRIEKAADGSGYPASLEVLVQGAKDASSPQGTMIYLLRSVPRDPFAQPGTQSGAQSENQPAAETWALRSYASPPDDPQPGKDVFDVHSKSAALGLNGTAYRTW